MTAGTTPRYRVWCLSWGEDEECGADVVPYELLSHEYNKQERRVVYVSDTLFSGALDAAEAYADHVHNQRDGYECLWPLTFRVRSPEGTTADFEVARDFVPEFTARAIPPAVREPAASAAPSEGTST